MWFVDEDNTLTIITDENSTIKIYSRLQGSDSGFEELSTEIDYKGDRVYETTISFSETGKYILKVVNESLSTTAYHAIEVGVGGEVSLTQEEHDKLMSIPTADENANTLLNKEIQCD